jgi:hypothetical protein
MIRSFAAFIVRVLRSHLAHVMLAASWTFILLVFVHPLLSQPQLVDCTPTQDEFVVIVDKFYPIWTTVIGAAHLPTIILAGGATKLFQRLFSLSCGPTAKVEVPLLFAFSAIQWFVLGYTIKSLIRRVRARK